MEFSLTDEQGWLAEAVEELVAGEPAERLWPALVEFGALDPELGVIERALVAHRLGRALAAVPYVDSAAAHHALEGIAAGTAAACCLHESGRRFAPDDPSTSLDGTRLTGEKCGVAFAATVDVLVVPAATPIGTMIGLAAPAALELEAEASLDPSLCTATVRFDGAEVGDGVVAGDIPRLAAVAGVLAAAEAVGAASAALGLACDYAAKRHQFGRTIASFQAIRHLLADMYVGVESSWSSVLYACASLDERTPDCLRTASIAKAYTSRATHEVAHGALQVLGGIAFTVEHPAHLYLRRIVVRGSQFGTATELEAELGRGLARPPVEALS